MTPKIKSNLLLGAFALAVITCQSFVSCTSTTGAVVRKPIALTCTAPSEAMGLTIGQCDAYQVAYSYKKDDLTSKPWDQLPKLTPARAPKAYNLPDTIRFDQDFQTGKTCYYRVKAGKLGWVSQATDTLTQPDSVQTMLWSDISNVAYRYYPPEKPTPPGAVK